MAYAAGNLNLMFPRLGTGDTAASLSSALWSYRSDDAVATVIAAGYISDGDDQGIKVDDVVIVIDSTASSETLDLCLVTVVDSAGLVTMIQLA